MKQVWLRNLAATALVLIGFALPNGAAPFSSGSDGSYGPLNVTSNTVLDVPESGVFNCTVISIAPNMTLRFRRNLQNTPVSLLASGDVTIGGLIDVSGHEGTSVVPGEGGPGGFDGGAPGWETLPGDGLGPGAGKGATLSEPRPGDAGFGTTSTAATTKNGPTYGNALLLPLIGGSGGGGATGLGGSGGGGAILIASSTSIQLPNSGAILARGGGTDQSVGLGSGGAIRLVAPVVAGSGSLDVSGKISAGQFAPAASGRIRIDALDRTGARFAASGRGSSGSEMLVFPPVVAKLDIIEAAGQPIAVGTGGPVRVQLPTNASTNQLIKLQARDFTGVVPITVVVTPDAGPSGRFTAEINMAGSTVAQVIVPVVIPQGMISHIHAWAH
jgi:hypothetical protein